MIGLIGGGQYLRLVDVVDLQSLQHLCFGKVSDPCFCHHRNRHGLLDPLDHLGVGHPCDATIAADV